MKSIFVLKHGSLPNLSIVTYIYLCQTRYTKVNMIKEYPPPPPPKKGAILAEKLH